MSAPFPDPGILANIFANQNRNTQAQIDLRLRASAEAEAARQKTLQLLQLAEQNDIDFLKVPGFNSLPAEEAGFFTEIQKSRRTRQKEAEKARELEQTQQIAAAPQENRAQVLAALRALQMARQAQGATPQQALADLGQLDAQRRANLGASLPEMQRQAAEDARNLRKEEFANEKDLRNQFVGISKDAGFIVQRNAMDRVLASAESPSASGDFALIFNFLKVLDPGSTVREGEFANVGRAGGLPNVVQGFFNKLQGDGQLSPALRKDILSRSRKLFSRAQVRQKERETEFRRLARREKLDPKSVVVNLRGEQPSPAADAEAQSAVPGAEFSHFDPETGNPIYFGPDGNPFEVTP